MSSNTRSCVQAKDSEGLAFACSQCSWKHSIDSHSPALDFLGEGLALRKFEQHDCHPK
jgi:hypothetical protein